MHPSADLPYYGGLISLQPVVLTQAAMDSYSGDKQSCLHGVGTALSYLQKKPKPPPSSDPFAVAAKINTKAAKEVEDAKRKKKSGALSK
jgi:hypothetical protein